MRTHIHTHTQKNTDTYTHTHTHTHTHKHRHIYTQIYISFVFQKYRVSYSRESLQNKHTFVSYIRAYCVDSSHCPSRDRLDTCYSAGAQFAPRFPAIPDIPYHNRALVYYHISHVRLGITGFPASEKGPPHLAPTRGNWAN